MKWVVLTLGVASLGVAFRKAFYRQSKNALIGVAGCLVLIALSVSHASASNGMPEEIVLWQNGAPGQLPGASRGVESTNDGISRVRNVGIPTLILHRPLSLQKKNKAVILCPGGGYRVLASVSTGNGVLEPFLKDGYAVLVLKYRTVPNPKEAEAAALKDAKRAVRLVREHAGEWGIDPHAIGMVGWSAGANLTLNLASHADNGNPQASDPIERQSCRPDFVAMLCPWPAGNTLDQYPISAVSPPAFIASARDDKVAPTRFAAGIAERYRKAGVECDLWIIDKGGHRAFSFDSKGEGSHWRARFVDWLGSIEGSPKTP